jgi:hypothetical protein
MMLVSRSAEIGLCKTCTAGWPGLRSKATRREFVVPVDSMLGTMVFIKVCSATSLLTLDEEKVF